MSRPAPADLLDRYHLGPRLAARWEEMHGTSLADLAAGAAGTVAGLWGEFTLTANLRGENVAWQATRRLTAGWPTLRGLACVDVGCGVGGVAAGCLGLGAGRVRAVDEAADLVALAAANLADREASGADATALRGDVLDPAVRRDLGRFDLVTAEHVLEHVADAEAGVAALADLAVDGGLVMTTIPNGDAVAYVAADGHYLLPGLTLLRDPADAAAYHRERFPDGHYGVGNYHSWDDYARWFAAAGLEVAEVEHVDATPWERLDAELDEARAAVAQAAAGLPGHIEGALRGAWEAYEQRVAAARRLPRPDAERRFTARGWRVYAWKGARRRRWQWKGPSAPAPERWREVGRRVPGLAALVRRVRGRG